MRRAQVYLLGRALLVLAAALGATPAAADSFGWYVPVGEQVPGGFDYIQIQMIYPYTFSAPAISAFTGPASQADQWSQSYLSESLVFAAASGPNVGDATLNFTIWIGGDREVDRPAFHFQAYRNGVMVDNADFICFGPGEMDWMVGPGTWTARAPRPPFIPGDANCDGRVNDQDLNLLLAHWGAAPEASWGQGDFTGEGRVDDADLNILLANWGAGVGSAVPEPASLSLLLLGLPALARRRISQ